MIVDSHAHLTDSAFGEGVEAMVQRAQKSGVGKIVNICTDLQTLEKGLALSKLHPWIFNAAATTPHDVEKEGEEFFPRVEELAKKKKLIAIGETGLDYFYEHSPRALQKKFLLRYFALALQADLPVIIHCRDAFEDLFAFAGEAYKKEKLLLHCFTGSLEEAKKALEKGWLISFSGIITFKKSEALREVARYVPLDRILVETDAPYLAPQSQRGKQNEPAFIHETVEILAALKGATIAEVAQATTANASKFFSF